MAEEDAEVFEDDLRMAEWADMAPAIHIVAAGGLEGAERPRKAQRRKGKLGAYEG